MGIILDSGNSVTAFVDRLTAVQGGAETIQSNYNELMAILDVARDPDSTSTTMDGSEQTLHEEATPSGIIQHLMSKINLTNIAGTRELQIRIYIKFQSGGSYIQISDNTVYLYTAAKVAETTNKTATIDGNVIGFNRYGYKITGQQAIAEGYVVVPHEHFSAAPGA